MWVNHKSRFEFVHVRLGEWLGWPQASPREPLRCHISSLVIVETLKYSGKETRTRHDGTMVTSKRKFDFEGSYLKRLGESIALLLYIRPHKVRLDPTSIKNPMLRLDCAGTLPPRARCSQAVAARGAPEREVDALPPPATPRGSGQPEGVW